MSADIKFYNLNSSNDDKVNDNFDNMSDAIDSVIKKDILKLNERLKEIVSNVTKLLVIEGITLQLINIEIDNIDNIINEIEDAINNLIIEKGNIKLGFFSSNKKMKRQRASSIDSTIEKVTKEVNNIIALKDEYNKLKQRNSDIKNKY